jgi:hypothetical protein
MPPNLSAKYARLAKGPLHVRFGSKGDMCAEKGHVCFYPRKRTCAMQLGMYAKGQKRTSDQWQPI